MNVDLLRQQQRWKDGLQELRTGLASVEAQVKHALLVSTHGSTSFSEREPELVKDL